MRSGRQQIGSFCPCRCQRRPPPAQSLLVHGHRHPGATSVGQQPGGRVWLPSFHPSSFSTCPQRLSHPHSLAAGPCHLSLPVATLWNGIQKSAIPVSAFVGRLGSLAQNSRRRQNIRATVGKITVPLNDRLCLSGTRRLTDFNRGHVVFRNDEKTGIVGSGDMLREREGTGTPGRTRNVPPPGHHPQSVSPPEPLGSASHQLPLCESLRRLIHLGIFGKPWRVGPDVLCVGGVSS